MLYLPVISFNKLQLPADSESNQAHFQGSAGDSLASRTIIYSNSGSCLKYLQYYCPFPGCLAQHLISATLALQICNSLFIYSFSGTRTAFHRII